jgi:hypothetical protein
MIALTLWRPRALVVLILGAILVAEAGRRRNGGTRVFPIWTSLAGPAWLAERMVCAWLAAGSRVVFGGVRYNGKVVSQAATPQRVLAEHLAKDEPKTLTAVPAPRQRVASRKTGLPGEARAKTVRRKSA